MAEYISRELAMLAISERKGNVIEHPYNVGLSRAQSIIGNIPAADVAEVRHGHWVPWKYKGMGLLPVGGYQCSRCGVIMDGIEDTPTAYHLHHCPNCGARMDKSEFAKDTNVLDKEESEDENDV